MVTAHDVQSFLERSKLPSSKHEPASGFTVWEVEIDSLIRRFERPIQILHLSEPSAKSSLADTSVSQFLSRSETRYSSLFIVFGPDAVSYDYLHLLPREATIMGYAEAAKLVRSKKPRQSFVAALRRHLPLARLSPYQNRHSVTGRMFFGRKDHLDDVFRLSGRNLAILGPRRIGKSSLAREAERQLRLRRRPVRLTKNTFGRPVAYVDCNLLPSLHDPDDFFFEAAISSMGISARETYHTRRIFGRNLRFLTPFEFFARLVREKYHDVTLIIDEVDSLISAESERHWPLFRKIQGLTDALPRGAESGLDLAFPRLILAGFLGLRQALYNPHFPLFGRITEVSLSNLGEEAVSQLVCEPMREIGIKIARPQEVVSRVRFHTGGMPSLVQSFCSEAVERLASLRRYQLTPEIIEDIAYSANPLLDYINWFDFSAGDLEKLAVYFASTRSGLTLSEFSRLLLREGINTPDPSVMTKAIDNLVFANIFRPVEPSKNSEYVFAVEAFRRAIAQRVETEMGLPMLLKALRAPHDAMGVPQVSQKRLIFVSYAHVDNEGQRREDRWLDRLLEHLAPLELQSVASIWSDKDIEIGNEWHSQIQAALESAKVAILLVSPAFLASKYVRNSELPILLKRAADKGLTIMPIIVRPCLYAETRFKYPDPKWGPEELSLASLQAVNSPTEALNGITENEQDRVLVSVARRVLSVIVE